MEVYLKQVYSVVQQWGLFNKLVYTSATANLGWGKSLSHIMKNINNKLVSKQW